MTFHIEIDVGDLEVAGAMLASELSDTCATVVRATVEAGEREALARATWQDRSGDARRNTKGVMLFATRDGALGELHSEVPYATILDGGSAEHVIEGRPYLHFVWKGVPITLRRVHHPGTRGYGYMSSAFLKMQSFSESEMERAADQIAERLERRLNRAA